MRILFLLYNIQFELDNAINIGEKLISTIEDRNWDDKVCYFADIYPHIIAFTEKVSNN